MPYPSLAPYGWNDRWAALFSSAVDDRPNRDQLVPGRVIRHDGVAVVVALPDDVRPLPLRRALEPAPVVGDWVVADSRTGQLQAVLDRTGTLERRAVHADVVQALAANVDEVLLVCGLDRPVKPGRIDRGITLAWDAGAIPLVVLTKVDLVDDDPDDIATEVAAAHPGVDVVVTSSVTGHGVDDLRQRITGRSIVVLGESGAGKSALTNALLHEDVAATGDVREGDAKGRHTTSARQGYLLPEGGLIVDIPGVRAVGLWAEPDSVTDAFPDVDELADGCRFANCGHSNEPGCAVLAAVAAGTLTADRLEAWHRLQREAASLQRRLDPYLNRQHGKRIGRMAREAQQAKRRRD